MGARSPRRGRALSTAYVLDTTLLIDHAKGRRDGVEMLARLFSETGRLYTCDVVTCEALSGGIDEERELITHLLDALEFVVIDPEGSCWAGDRRRELRAEGRRSPLGDSLIAAVAWCMDATIVTRNPVDFERFGVPVLGYGEPVGT